MTLSARNQITGRVASVVRGPVSSMVKIDIGGGKTVTASVTTEAIDQLHLVVGSEATAVFKASSVMIWVDE
jgi:molybdopterin-binding protein